MGADVKNTYDIVTVQTVTQEQLDDVVCAALEGGITYWCDEAKANVHDEDRYLSEMLTRGAIIELHDREEDKWYQLALPAFLTALGEEKFDFDDYDAGDADNVIQRAIFGGVVYG